MNQAKDVEISVCTGKSCGPRGSAGILAFLQRSIADVRARFGEATVVRSCDCLGHCERGPNISVNGGVANGVSPQNAMQKIDEALHNPAPKIEIDLDKIMSDF